MKISLNWLKEYIQITETPEEIAHMLTMSGLEVEGVEQIEPVKGGLRGVVIGEVIECSKHPNADKLSVAKVDIGNGLPVPIVCGAPNVSAGQKVIVATTGTTLYGPEDKEFVIKKVKIRGEESEGMICAEDELGLGNDHSGIMVLDTLLPNGTPASDYFNLQTDTVLEIGLTPNRADATSHLGVARDLKALLNREIQWPDVSEFNPDERSAPVEVVVENHDACPRYSGLTISGINIGESPAWLMQKLLSIGQLPINNIVDVTNYVLHEMGQPLHAFDLEKIDGRKITVKTLPEGTLFVTLDEKKRSLLASDLMICSASEGMCIAGVFGGIDSGVTSNTKSIFLESACFSPDYIRRTSMMHGLKTDAAFRFERGTDPEKTVYALHRAALLIKEVAGGIISSDVVDIYPEPARPVSVSMTYKNIDRLIGKKIPKNIIHDILIKLDFEVEKKTNTGFLALVPTYRIDVTREADVIEEILRIYGYDNIELKPQTSSEFLAEFPEIDPDKEQLKMSELLTGIGYSEIITNSLTRPDYAIKSSFLDAENSVEIINKLSEDLAVLRQTLLFTGLEVINYNISHRQKDIKIFEFGKTYQKKNGKYQEEFLLSIWATGNYESENWITKTRPLHFHDFYGAVLKIINKFIKGSSNSQIFKDPIFEYGLRLVDNNHVFAKLGLLSKEVTKLVELPQKVFYAEVDFPWLLDNAQTRFGIREIPKFPEVRRDLSLVLNERITFEEIRKVTNEKEFKHVLKKVNVFDYYSGDNLEKGKKAYALSFILQDEQKTLKDKDIDRIMGRLIERYESEIGAIIRK